MPTRSRELLETMMAIDINTRQIEQKELVVFKCHSCSNSRGVKWDQANRSFKEKGWAYQCPECLKKKIGDAKAVIYDEQILKAHNLIDTTSRSIKAHEHVSIKCHGCDTVGSPAWTDAQKSLQRYGHAYQCPQCLKKKYAKRKEGGLWLDRVRAAAQSPEHKQRARENSIKYAKKYFEADILKVIKDSGISSYSGDLSSPSNVIQVSWEDGVSRSIRIRRFMIDGAIARPKINNDNPNHLKFLEKLKTIGLEIEELENGKARLTYRGQSWTQKWKSALSSSIVRRMKNIDIGVGIKNLLDSGISLNKACKAMGVPNLRYYRNIKNGIGVMETAISTKSFEQLIQIEGAIYNKALSGVNYRPDIRLEERKLIIETDGMRYHSEEKKSKDYHFKKWEAFNNLGYNLLAFSEFEVKEKREIVDSMINNKLGKSKIVRARKCEIKEVDNTESNAFFDNNHLRGRGKGKTFGLYSNGKLVCAIRFYEESGVIHISRFASLVGHSVTGGYSKLLKLLPKDKDIINFVDRRHGSGKHLLAMGFIKTSEHIGFEWTDGYFHWNRRKYLGNSGYDIGLKKFWDYGQIKYVRPKIENIPAP
jgi:very-short-patch-repair endonuclease/Zn finger protein HypA/HybF involved in hydrogenase expression